MKINYTICSSLAVLLLCFCTVGHSQDDAVSMVLDILKSGDQEMQAVAISMVKDMPGEEVTKALAAELPGLSPTSQVQLLSALGDRGDAAARPAVVTAAKSEDQSVRIAAFRALGQLGDDTSVVLLAQAAAGAKGAEQKAARDSLYRLRGPKVDQVILDEIPKAEAGAKVELISSMGERNISAGVAPLLKTAKDSDRKVRTESFRVLKVIASPEHLPDLVRLLIEAKSSSDRSECQKTVAAVAHKIEDKSSQAQAVLTVLPTVKQTRSRCSLLGVLGKIGDNKALPVLTAAMKEKDPEIQTAAIRSLAEWPTPEPLLDLLKVAEGSQNKLHRILALRGFVRLLGLDNKRPAEKTIEMYKKAMSLAPDAGEKKRVLSGLANAKSRGALEMATAYLEDESLSREAEYAVVKIAEGIGADFPELAKDTLKKIIKATKNNTLREQAQESLDKMEQ
ncbi:MAG: HEAT repeat domain-containing protein [Planctomycetota bacterium]|nr:HEAT repeat domain-containing protein [Planctomycetota bacterium]